MSTFLFTIDRASISLSPLVLTGRVDANPLGIINYAEPARQARIRYAPSSDDVEGDVALSSVWQQTFHQFDLVTHKATTEAISRASLAEFRAAIGQFRYTVTVVVDGAPAEAWTCDMGSIGPIDRTLVNITHHHPVASVQIPCRPTPSIGA